MNKNVQYCFQSKTLLDSTASRRFISNILKNQPKNPVKIVKFVFVGLASKTYKPVVKTVPRQCFEIPKHYPKQVLNQDLLIGILKRI